MTNQNALTLIAPIKHNQYAMLKDTLGKINKTLIDERHFFEAPDTIHFARWVLLDEATSGSRLLPARLVFESNFDGDKEKFIDDLCIHLAKYIDKVYEHCVGYPEVNERNTESRKSYLQKLNIKYAAFYIGAPGRSVAQIRQELVLRNYIRNFLNEHDWENKPAIEIHKVIKEHVFNNPKFEWAKTPVKLPKVNWLPLVLSGILALILLPVLLPVILIWIIIVQLFYERHDVPLGLTRSQLEDARIQDMEQLEDIEFQNQFTQVLIMKPGRVRLITLQAFMLLTKMLSENLLVKGKLMHIPTIHFARWVMIDDNKRMIFFSNFDGSWQQYLCDFIDKSGWGMTAIWSNTIGFPKAKFLFWDGAYDEEHFLAWSRYYQIKTQVWYSAYPHLSLKNIINNSLIHLELQKDLTKKGAALFLQRF